MSKFAPRARKFVNSRARASLWPKFEIRIEPNMLALLELYADCVGITRQAVVRAWARTVLAEAFGHGRNVSDVKALLEGLSPEARQDAIIAIRVSFERTFVA